MILIRIIAVFVISFVTLERTHAQRIDTLNNIRDEIPVIDLRDKNVKDPKKATILSAVIPGAGQVYNEKAWKVPLIYGGFATNIFFIDFNNRRYQFLLDALRAFDDPDRENPLPNLNRDGLVRQVNFWRRNRDLNYFIFIGIYALNIVDAHVDAHLSSFDVSDDLTFRLEPVYENLWAGNNMFGLSLKINF
ncbi:hypothetical protein EGN73_12125 [Arthrospiribacter ruber]|uniref:DUF5683 domain-containing protein n=2 Tax=Arthrospiribacter ruber TaxID=2487934 RepID=A0A951IYD7_9BACT|nr:DUF5683 domain-containing protein [Arthrospiribacter ruber]MBW3468554.1 hypothetical protein [Arthrospiribacter ruber]